MSKEETVEEYTIEDIFDFKGFIRIEIQEEVKEKVSNKLVENTLKQLSKAGV